MRYSKISLLLVSLFTLLTVAGCRQSKSSDVQLGKDLHEFDETLRVKAIKSMMAGDSPDDCRNFVTEQLSIFKEQLKYTPDQIQLARVCAFNAVWDAVIHFSATSTGVSDKDREALKQFEPFCVELQQEPEVQQDILISAIYDNDSSLIEWLVKQGANVNTEVKTGFTLLLCAIQPNPNPDSVKTVETLLDAGADCNHKCYMGMTATMHAIILNRNDVLKVLLAKNPDLSAVNDKGQTALMLAKQQNNAEAAVLLKDAGEKE